MRPRFLIAEYRVNGHSVFAIIDVQRMARVSPEYGDLILNRRAPKRPGHSTKYARVGVSIPIQHSETIRLRLAAELDRLNAGGAPVLSVPIPD